MESRLSRKMFFVPLGKGFIEAACPREQVLAQSFHFLTGLSHGKRAASFGARPS